MLNKDYAKNQLHPRITNELKERIENQNNNEFLIAPPIPRNNFLIELSNACNDVCIFCANRKMTRAKGMMNPSLLTHILDEAASLGIREVGFYTTGEPLINPNLAQYVAYAKNAGFQYVYITTNGALATPDKIKPVIDAGLDSIKFSINATNREEYLFIHGKDDFHTVISNLKHVYRYKKELNKSLRVFVSYIATRLTPVNEERLAQLFSSFCDEIVTLCVIDQIGLMPEIYEYLALEDQTTDFAMIRTIPCKVPFNRINISCEGYLTACCTDFQNYLAYADLNKTSLEEAWNNEVITEFRKRHINNDVSGTSCANCVRRSHEKPAPLCQELCTDYDNALMLDGTEVKRRVDLYLNTKHKA